MVINIKTKGFNDIVNITEKVSKEVENSGIRDGVCLVFSPHATAGLSLMEYEQGLVSDLKRALERLAPMKGNYDHNGQWAGDDNGYAHIRSVFLRPSVAVPVKNGKLEIGTWQQIVFIDFDNRARDRQIIIKTIGNEVK